MKVTFIAHAGIHIDVKGASLLIDPWFSDSTVERPLIESVGSGHQTIDFQIPQTVEKIADYKPDVILISHFHAHHSPLHDLVALCRQTEKTIHIFFPKPAEDKIYSILGKLNHVHLDSFEGDGEVSVCGFDIRGMRHTAKDHMAWFVHTSEGIFNTNTSSVLHIADARVHSDRNRRDLDDVWQKFAALRPDMFFLSSGGNCNRLIRGEKPVIYEASVLTPVEAAKLIELIGPKSASLIGCYNHSMFNGRSEYIRPKAIIEEEFEWATSWLSPKTRCIFLRPGTILVKEGDTISTQYIFSSSHV